MMRIIEIGLILALLIVGGSTLFFWYNGAHHERDTGTIEQEQ